MTPTEYEWNCELIENEINYLMAYHAIKMGQIREKPHMVGWYCPYLSPCVLI